MPAINYDASVASLLDPGHAPTWFRAGVAHDDVQTGAECARMAYYAFEQAAGRARLVHDLAIAGFTGLATFDAGGTQAFGARRASDKVAVLAFRGTQATRIEDILTDLVAPIFPWGGAGVVHLGFLNAWGAVRQDVRQWLATECAGHRLLFCGHSLGAALATLAASECQPARLVTVASPRVGNSTFLASLHPVDHTRLVNCADSVPGLPPAIVYRHPAHIDYIDHVGVRRGNLPHNAIQDDQEVGVEVYQPRPGEVPTRLLADHAPANYLRALFP